MRGLVKSAMTVQLGPVASSGTWCQHTYAEKANKVSVSLWRQFCPHKRPSAIKKTTASSVCTSNRGWYMGLICNTVWGSYLSQHCRRWQQGQRFGAILSSTMSLRQPEFRWSPVTCKEIKKKKVLVCSGQIDVVLDVTGILHVLWKELVTLVQNFP